MSLLTPLFWVLLILPLFVFAFIHTKKVNLHYLVLFVVYFLSDCYIQHLSKLHLNLDFIGLKFAWIGKILSLIFWLIIILLVSNTERQKIGWTTESNSKQKVKLGVLCFLGFLFFDLIFKLILLPKGADFDIETFAFQATMPGLTEEIVFRGISLWLLDKAFEPKWKFKEVEFGWGFIIVTVLFGIGHGVVLTGAYQFKFDFITIIDLTLISYLSLGILRKFAGNLIYPILGHNAINLMNVFVRML